MLSYEGYVPMAEKELRKLCIEANEKYPSIVKIAAVHILGDCPVEAASVILCASSPQKKVAPPEFPAASRAACGAEHVLPSRAMRSRPEQR